MNFFNHPGWDLAGMIVYIVLGITVCLGHIVSPWMVGFMCFFIAIVYLRELIKNLARRYE